jgi:hypothetical protein
MISDKTYSYIAGWGCSKSSISRHCELRGTKQEAIQSVDFQKIASGYRPRNDVVTDFLNSGIFFSRFAFRFVRPSLRSLQNARADL